MPLLTAPDGRRLSKRDRDLDLGVLREKYTAREIVGAMANAAGLTEEYTPCSPAELVSVFDWDTVSREDLTVVLPEEKRA